MRSSQPVQPASGSARRVGHSYRRGAVALMAFAFTLLGCAGTETTPTFPPPTGRVAVGAALEPFAGGRLRAYAKTSGVPAFDLEVWSMADAIRAAEDGQIEVPRPADRPVAAAGGWVGGFLAALSIQNPGVDIR